MELDSDRKKTASNEFIKSNPIDKKPEMFNELEFMLLLKTLAIMADKTLTLPQYDFYQREIQPLTFKIDSKTYKDVQSLREIWNWNWNIIDRIKSDIMNKKPLDLSLLVSFILEQELDQQGFISGSKILLQLVPLKDIPTYILPDLSNRNKKIMKDYREEGTEKSWFTRESRLG